MARRCASAMSREMPLSGRPCDQAKPELVVASALKPRLCRYSALPTSQGFGMTKQPASCICRKVWRFSSMLGRVAVIGELLMELYFIALPLRLFRPLLWRSG